MYRALEVALCEVGYLEKHTPDCLDEKTANAGSENFTKYARDLDAIEGFYNGAKQGYPWCDVFVDWCFVQAYGVERAMELLCQPAESRGAGCRYSLGYYEEAGRRGIEPRVGDQIFFQSEEGRVCHTGLVVGVDDTFVYTVEGNTSDEEGIVPNGGCVRRKSYKKDFPGIAGYGMVSYAQGE